MCLCKLEFEGFSCNHHLQYHMRTHTGDKPYKCDVHVLYVVKCLVRILTYRDTLEHIQVINPINVMGFITCTCMCSNVLLQVAIPIKPFITCTCSNVSL
jgi:hypothetical protein